MMTAYAAYSPTAVLIVMAFTVAVCLAVHLFAFVPVVLGTTSARLVIDHYRSRS